MLHLKIDNQLDKLATQYLAQNRKPVSFNFRKKTAYMLNGHARAHKAIHYVHPYPGRVSPDIILYLLSLPEFKSLTGHVLDPFAGTGTVLLEAMTNPVIKRPALGIEINPLARLISKVKTTVIKEEQVKEALAKVKVAYTSSTKGQYQVPDFPNIDLWFSTSAKRQLAKLKHSIETANLSPKYADFLWVSFSKIVRRVSKADPNIAPPVYLKPEKYKKNAKEYKRLINRLAENEKPKVWNLFEKASLENCKLATLNDVVEVKSKTVKAEIISADATGFKLGTLAERGRMIMRRDKSIQSNSIDIILTSPPYLTAQKYIRSTRLELLWLGYTAEQLNAFEKDTVGTEGTARNTVIETFELPTVDAFVSLISKKSNERGIMVYQYFKKMKLVLRELYRVLRKDGYAIFIMGDNTVLKKSVKTYELLKDVAVSEGFREIATLKDNIPTRSMMTKRNGSGGLIKSEYIIILKK